jgi:hypothetical protein
MRWTTRDLEVAIDSCRATGRRPIYAPYRQQHTYHGDFSANVLRDSVDGAFAIPNAVATFAKLTGMVIAFALSWWDNPIGYPALGV